MVHSTSSWLEDPKSDPKLSLFMLSQKPGQGSCTMLWHVQASGFGGPRIGFRPGGPRAGEAASDSLLKLLACTSAT